MERIIMIKHPEKYSARSNHWRIGKKRKIWAAAGSRYERVKAEMKLSIYIFYFQSYCSLRSQQLGQNPFHITFGDGILPCMSRDSAIFMTKHLAEYYLWTATFQTIHIFRSQMKKIDSTRKTAYNLSKKDKNQETSSEVFWCNIQKEKRDGNYCEHTRIKIKGSSEP